MDMHQLTHPTIEDRDAFQEFSDVLSDRVVEIEHSIAKLRKTPGDREIVASLFRAVHNIKGDAAFCKLPFAVLVAQPIESILARFRNGELVFTEVLAETILLAMDRLEQAVDGLLSGQNVSGLGLLILVQGLEKVSEAPAPKVDDLCAEVVEAVTGFHPIMSHATVKGRAPVVHPSSDPHAADLAFFRTLALQYEGRSNLFKGRTTRVLRLAQETNRVRNNLVDPMQLEAAVYMHDLGMMFVPESVWLKVGRFTAEDKAALRLHPVYGAGLLERIPGWEPAAQMVAQHHEMPDGGGYPNGLKADDICDGAKILAIVDAFEAVMLKHIHRGQTRSVLRAIAEVNASTSQFAPEWIEPFNSVIRRTVRTPAAA